MQVSPLQRNNRRQSHLYETWLLQWVQNTIIDPRLFIQTLNPRKQSPLKIQPTQQTRRRARAHGKTKACLLPVSKKKKTLIPPKSGAYHRSQALAQVQYQALERIQEREAAKLLYNNIATTKQGQLAIQRIRNQKDLKDSRPICPHVPPLASKGPTGWCPNVPVPLLNTVT